MVNRFHSTMRADIFFVNAPFMRVDIEILFLFRDRSLRTCGLTALPKFLRNILCVHAP